MHEQSEQLLTTPDVLWLRERPAQLRRTREESGVLVVSPQQREVAMRKPAGRAAARGHRAGPFRWAERLFVMGGAGALLWCAYTMTNASIVQRLARERLESTSSVNTSSATSSIAPSSVAPGTPLAELSIPRVGLSAVVFEGSDDHTLRLGLGHIETTPLPGELGNVGIAGHRDSFFRPLQNVQIGDDILLDTPEEHSHYLVSSLSIVSPNAVSVIGPTMDAMLTLVTCYPFRFIGQAPDRFVVHAIRVEDAPAVAARTPTPTSPIVRLPLAEFRPNHDRVRTRSN